MARKKKIEQVILAAGEDNIDQNTNVEEPTSEPTEPTEETGATESATSDFVMSGYARAGYIPVAGEWYPALEEVRPRVYHKYAHEDIYKTLYPDLINNEENGEGGEEGGVDPVDPVEDGGETPAVEPTPDEPTTDPTDETVEP